VIVLVDILMATYNGKKFICEQIESILSQSFDNWHLYINDDNSADSTLKIIKEYETKYPEKITVSKSAFPLGAKGNFFRLTEFSKSEYIMFCDQDDVWKADKIEKTLKLMQNTENGNKNIPVLVHTDLCVVDENLKVINPSYFKLSRIKNKTDLNRAIVQNCVTGCTMMVNKALLKLVGNDNKSIIMHDWWLYLIASSFGKIAFLNEQTILYRQHTKNEVGAKGLKYRKKDDLKNSLIKTYNQAECFYNIFKDILTDTQKKLLQEYIDLPKYSKIKKIRTTLKYRFFKHSFLRKIIHLLVC